MTGNARLLAAIFILKCVLGPPIFVHGNVMGEVGEVTEVVEAKEVGEVSEVGEETEVVEGSKVVIETVFMPPNCARKVVAKDFVRYQYYGMLEDGTYFDSSHSRGHSYDTYVSNGWLIPGMDQGLLGMCVNEHRVITIPPELAYGEQGSGSIPGNATLIFNTILLDVWSKQDTVKVVITEPVENCERKLATSDYVRYHYNGTLSNGEKFHSSYQDGTTYNTYVNQGWLIKGMDEGLLGACVGEKRTITIPPFMAYGPKGDGKNIPASATAIFAVEIIDFHNPKDQQEVTVTKAVEGCTRKLQVTDYIRYHYNGTFVDGTLFDSSYQRNTTYNTYVGMKHLIPGVDRGLVGACIGERRRIVVPPHLGYGEPGIDNVIPPSAVLVFDVHVIDFHNPKDVVEITVLQEPAAAGSREVKKDDYVVYDYELTTMDGEVLAGSDGKRWGIYVGDRQVAKGCEQGMMGMRVGEKRKLVIPPHIGYGEFGKEGFVPGSAVLVYHLHVKEIHDGVPTGEIVLFNTKEEAKNIATVFKAADSDEDEFLSNKELTTFIERQVASDVLYLAPHLSVEDVMEILIEDYKDKEMSEIQFGKFLRQHKGVKHETKEL